jgi:hypothetical protein
MEINLALRQNLALVMGSFHYLSHHDATLMLRMFCCVSGPDLSMSQIVSFHSSIHSDANMGVRLFHFAGTLM